MVSISVLPLTELFQKSLSLNKDLKVKFWPEFSGEVAAIKNGGSSYVHTAILEMDNQQGTCCTAQGTLLSVMWHPRREGSLGENGYMYICMAE